MNRAPEVHAVQLDTIELSVTSLGDGPRVLLLHGFPDIGYTWHRQLRPIAEAGHRVLAPDQRGYGWSECPTPIDAYSVIDLVGDVVALLAADGGAGPVVLVGHDWGSIVAWHVALMRPDLIRGLALLSVPYQPRGDRSILDHIRATDPDGPFGYMLFFQEEGEAESLMDPDPIEALRTAHWKNSGSWPSDADESTPVPAGLPPYLDDGAMENYGRAFARTGFRGGINWYRNMQRNWELTRPWHGAPLTVPTTFIAGSNDFVVARGDGGLGSAVGSMDQHCTDFRGHTIVDGAGHWVHQEAPVAVNDSLLRFIVGLD